MTSPRNKPKKPSAADSKDLAPASLRSHSSTQSNASTDSQYQITIDRVSEEPFGRKPIMISSGHTFSEQTVSDLKKYNKSICPLSNAPIDLTHTAINHSLLMANDRFERHKQRWKKQHEEDQAKIALLEAEQTVSSSVIKRLNAQYSALSTTLINQHMKNQNDSKRDAAQDVSRPSRKNPAFHAQNDSRRNAPASHSNDSNNAGNARKKAPEGPLPSLVNAPRPPLGFGKNLSKRTVVVPESDLAARKTNLLTN